MSSVPHCFCIDDGVRVLLPDSSPCLSRLTFRPFHLQPTPCHLATLGLSRYVTVAAGHVYPPGRSMGSEGVPSRGPGFTLCEKAPRLAWPNQVRLRYGLVVCLRLLSTFPHGNAVTV
jgi:hypothetical protein